MPLSNRTLILIAVFLFGIRILYAQTDPTGHWEGVVSAPFGEIRIEVDLIKDAKGDLMGTFSQPAEKLRGLRLASVEAGDKSVTFDVNGGSGTGTFEGNVGDDNKSISGVFITGAAPNPLSFSLVRTGEARIDAPPKSPPIRKEMEGVWDGTIQLNPGQLRVVLKMANQPDGTSSGTLTSVDEGGIESPVVIVQDGAALSLDIKVLSARWSGQMNAGGSQIAGTFTTAKGVSLPLTFRRAAN